MDPTVVGRLNRNLVQDRRFQAQWQQQAGAQHELRIQQQQQQQQRQQRQQQQQRDILGLKQHDQQAQDHTPAQHQQRHMQQPQLQNASPLSQTTPSLPPTQQQTPEQPTGSQSSVFASAVVTCPQLQRSIAASFISTTQQFTPNPRQAAPPQLPNKVSSLLLPPTTPIRKIRTSKPFGSGSKAPQLKSNRTAATAAASAWTERALRNEKAEHVRLERQRKQEIERNERIIRVLQDPNAIYHSYREVLERFPLRRGEHPNPYLIGLLANQPLSKEAASDRRLAIQYAKSNWEAYWELKDLDFVVGEAKKAIEKKTGTRGHVSGAFAMARTC
ncbi:hypothetical protein SVAN01_04898 [Stagonosporopsis vannaccii]|nr:hypothetical protein SVAN01_04898 [Stagonosporopsis vannaccii]